MEINGTSSRERAPGAPGRNVRQMPGIPRWCKDPGDSAISELAQAASCSRSARTDRLVLETAWYKHLLSSTACQCLPPRNVRFRPPASTGICHRCPSRRSTCQRRVGSSGAYYSTAHCCRGWPNGQFEARGRALVLSPTPVRGRCGPPRPVRAHALSAIPAG